MGINNPMIEEHINALFGQNRADKLRRKLDGITRPQERELLIIEELCQALKSYDTRYTLPFRFKNVSGKRTSHHLIFVSKGFRGYEIMKEIMAKECSSCIEGVPSFEYSPADILPKQSLLFQLSRPLDDLENMLLEEYEGQSLTMKEIYEQHNIDRPYIKPNYKKILLKMEKEGIIKTTPHKKGSFADHVTVTFPRQRRRK